MEFGRWQNGRTCLLIRNIEADSRTRKGIIMDIFDRISIWAIAVLIVSSLVLISGHVEDARADRNGLKRTAVAERPPGGELERHVKLVRNLLETDGVVKAEALLKDLIRRYPYEAELQMLMGDTLMREQKPVRAMRAYKEAVDLNPDYLDRKTPLFQGKKLKIAVGEAMTEIETELRLKPGDAALKAERKMIYYLQRRIAGSCG